MGLRIVHGKWHYRFQHAGQEHTANTDWDATERDPTKAQRNRERALQAEAKARAEIECNPESAIRLRQLRFSEAAKQFLAWAEIEHRDHPATARRLRTSFASWLEFLPSNVTVVALTAGRVEDYKAWRRCCPVCKGKDSECDACEGTGQGVREITLRHDLYALSKFFVYARKQRWAAGNPLDHIEIPSDRDAIRFHRIQPDEFRAYLTAALAQGHQDLHDLAVLMWLQGARPGEVLATRAEHVDFTTSTWIIPTAKSHAGRRTLKLAQQSAFILDARAARTSGAGWLFPSPKRPAQHLVKLASSHEETLAAVGQSWVLYDLRHNFATHCAAAGMPLPQLAYILGHRDLKTLMRYVHVSAEQAAAAMDSYGPTIATAERDSYVPPK